MAGNLSKIGRIRLLSVLAAVIFTWLTGQGQVRWAPVVGMNVSTFTFRQNLLDVHQSVGGSVGLMGELMFPGIGIGMDFGLQYNLHGAKMNFGDFPVWSADGYKSQEQCWLHTIQIPVNIRFKYTRLNGVEDIIAPFVYAGPLFSLTVGHNRLDALEYPGGCINLQCGLGAELWKRWQISAGYYWGVTYEIRTRKLDNYSARPQGWRVQVAYFF